jgi:hypothetical protein
MSEWGKGKAEWTPMVGIAPSGTAVEHGYTRVVEYMGNVYEDAVRTDDDPSSMTWTCGVDTAEPEDMDTIGIELTYFQELVAKAKAYDQLTVDHERLSLKYQDLVDRYYNLKSKVNPI